jgi:hypothetical protein
MLFGSRVQGHESKLSQTWGSHGERVSVLMPRPAESIV